MNRKIFYMIKVYRFSIYCIASALLMTACSGGGRGGGGEVAGNTIPPNPDFVAKATAVNFNRIRLYQGHVKDVDRTAMTELDASNLSSGELITIDVEFEITGEIQDYSLVAQLVPQSILTLFNPGNTIGEIFSGEISSKNTDAPPGENTIDLGGVYIDAIKPSLLQGVFHAKLPTLEQDTVFKVAVTPSLDYLSSGKEINNTDIESVPVLIDDRELIVKKLDAVSVTLVETPDLTVDNDFTEIEIGGGFDTNGFSIEPIFQTSVKIDMTTFNDLEEVVLSLSWAAPSGATFPLGLLSSNADGTPVISTDPHFTIKRSNEALVTLPVVAYAPIKTQSALIKQATFIQDVADQAVKTGNFDLVVSYVDNNAIVTDGNVHRLSIPLVSQDSRALKIEPNNLTQFSVLRAGSTDRACLTIGPGAFDIDSGLLGVDSSTQIIASGCPDSESPPSGVFLWRYDDVTKQFVHKIVDDDGDNYCLTVVGEDPVSALMPRSFILNPANYKLNKCRYRSPINFGQLGSDAQRFEFEGDKIRVENSSIYLDVDFANNEVQIARNINDAPDFYTDLNGVAVDSNGRLFYAGKFYDRSWGDADLAQVSLSFGGESYVDYLPVVGATAEGRAVITASLFGQSADLLSSRFGIKRYSTKKMSMLGNNYPDVSVGNGAELIIDVAGFSAVESGKIGVTNVTDTYVAAAAGDIFSDVGLELEPLNSSWSNKMDEKFLQITFIVVVVPVTIEGGIKGEISFDVGLEYPEIGVSVDAKNNVALSGYLSAKLDAAVVSAGIEGKIDVLDQNLNFATSQGFTVGESDTLSYDIGASLGAELKLLRGEVSAFVEYRCVVCRWPGSKRNKKATIYSSPYLYNKDWSIFDASASALEVEL